jgi:YVTN family beta-propeller protein
MTRKVLSRHWGQAIVVALAALFVGVSATPAVANPLAYVPLGDVELGTPATGVAIVDVATGARVGTIPLSVPAFYIAINPAGTRAYVVDEDGVGVINLKTRTVVKTITGVGGGDIAVNPSGTRAYVTDENTDMLDVINTDNNTVMPSIPVGDQPRAVVVNTSGTRAYTGNTIAPYSISVVNLITDVDTSDVTSSNLNRPENLGIDPSGAKVYAANFGASAGGTTVAVLDPSNNGVGSVTVGTTPTSVMVNPSGTRAYVADRDSSSLSIIETVSSTNVGTVSLGFAPIHIAITPDGTRALITGQDPDTGDGEDAVFDLLTNKIVAGPSSLPAANGAAIAPAEQPVPVVNVTTGLSKQSTRFDASGSSGGPIVRYDWSFGDGKRAEGAGPRIAHVYAKAGTYTVKLTETDGCAANAVFGPFGVSFNGHSPFCNGSRASQKTLTVRVPRAAVAVVETKRATVAANGLIHVRVACVKELSCTGIVVLRGVAGHPAHQQPVTLGEASFESIPAGGKAVLTVKLSSAGLAMLRSHKTLNAQATATASHAGGQKRSRTTSLTLTFEAS